MNGAQSLIASLVKSDVEVCFSNPGTSEMHFVAGTKKTIEVKRKNMIVVNKVRNQ